MRFRAFSAVLASTLAFATLPLATATSASAATVDEVVAKALDARGGLDKLRALKSVKTTGKQSLGAMEIPFTIVQARPMSFRMEAVFQGQTIVQVYQPGNSWMVMPMTGSTDPEKIGAEESKQIEQQADIDGPLVDWKKKGHKVVLAGEEEIDGSPAWKLAVELANGNSMTIYIDQATGLEIRDTMKIKKDGSEIEAESDLSGFKKVDGFTMPYTITSKMNGQTVSTITLDKVELNVPVDEKIFVMPPKKAAAPAATGAAPAEPKKEAPAEGAKK